MVKGHINFKIFYFFHFYLSFLYLQHMIRGRYSLLEQVSQRSTITCSRLLTTYNLMGISLLRSTPVGANRMSTGHPAPHTLDHNQRYVYWFPLTWSQRVNFSSLTFAADYKILIFCGTVTRKKGR